MPRLNEIRDDLIAALSNHYGLSNKPAKILIDPITGSNLFERLAKVALSLVATPKVASQAFEALSLEGMLKPEVLAQVNPLELDDILKQARVAMAIKSLRPLQKLARWALDRGDDFTVESTSGLATESIRDEWRTINGVGLASGDALLLFGLGRVSYPIDRSTYRIFVRHGWLDSTAEYDEARSMVERFAQIRDSHADQVHNDLDEVASVELLVDLSGWFERVGRDFCKPSQARCERCPLHSWLPPNGPVEVE